METQDKWQPIETAPKDGTSILAICYTKHSQWYDVVFWDNDRPEPFNWINADGPGNHRKMYTHWMPLPAPPVHRL